MSIQRHQTKTQIAIDVVRDRIQSGELQPGARLRTEDLAAELEMSPTPVREALRHLAADGLVDYRPHSGIVVAEHSRDEVAEIMRLRLALEPLATELAVPNLTGDRRQRLQRLHESFLLASERERGPEMGVHNAQWHWAIYDASQSRILLDFVRRLWERAPLRALPTVPEQTEEDGAFDAEELRDVVNRSWWQPRWAGTSRATEIAAEHSVVMERILAEDAPGASAAMHAHLAASQSVLLGHLLEPSGAPQS